MNNAYFDEMELVPIPKTKAAVDINEPKEIEISISSSAERIHWVDYTSKPRYFVPCKGSNINTVLEKHCIPLHVILPGPGGRRKVMIGFTPDYRKAKLENQEDSDSKNVVLYSPPYSAPECLKLESLPLFFAIAVCAYLRVQLWQRDFGDDSYPAIALHKPGFHCAALVVYFIGFISVVNTSQFILEFSRSLVFVDFWLLVCFFLDPDLSTVLLITGQLLVLVLLKLRSRKSFFYTPTSQNRRS